MRIAIMQPYFIPYAGYFRLFSAADLFVVYDCVQFVRRGWVHRNRLPNVNGELNWLTLPLKKAPQNVLIKDLEFADDHSLLWKDRLAAFPQLCSAEFQQNPLCNLIQKITLSPVEYIISTIQTICHALSLPFTIAYSSELNLPESIRGEERIIEIAKYYHATEYINLPNGRALYNVETFKQHGLKLEFLPEYAGSYDSILQRLIKDKPLRLKNEIMEQSGRENACL